MYAEIFMFTGKCSFARRSAVYGENIARSIHLQRFGAGERSGNSANFCFWYS